MNKKQRKPVDGDSMVGAEKRIITDPRFASAHTDPRFRRAPKRETKVAIDARFKRVFTDKQFSSASAPVDKRGKRRRGKSGKDSLREYYRIEEEKKKPKKDEDVDEESESEEECEEESESEIDAKSVAKSDFSEGESGEEDDEEEEEEVSASEKEEDTDEDDSEEEDDIIFEGGRPELVEENIPEIEKETHRLAIVNMDWTHVSASDLFVVLSSFLPKDGQILSVSVYPSEFGLQRMKEEEIHGPVGLFENDKKNEDDDEDEDEDEEEEEDEDIINQKLRAYEISRLKYYYAVVECDSSATADYLYKTCDGVEFERSSNKLDLRFIPDSMEFKHPPRDVATEAPASYEGLDYHSRALQLSKVNLSWDEDEPHRIKTLNRKFKPDQLAKLELNEFLASDESESDDDENKPDKKEKMKDKYRALIQSGDDGSDEDEDDKDQDMEVTFNTELEDLSKRILEKKDNKSETVWEAYLRKRTEKKKAKKNKGYKDDSSSSSDDDEDDYGRGINAEEMNEGTDDFFEEELPVKKEGKKKKKNSDKAEKEAEEEASKAELELLLADEKAGDGGIVKGYNIKRKGKKGKLEIAEEKIPDADLDDPRFSALFTSPLFALDPTDPQFKRSAAYARQLAQKQNGDQKNSAGNGIRDITKPESGSNDTAKSDNLGSKKEKHELSSAIKSVKMKIQQKDSEKKQSRKVESSSSLVQRIKKKAKTMAN